MLDLGYEDITVLDISEAALARARQRLGDRAKKVNWVVADIATFMPIEKYDFWHDRATFHFLTDTKEIAHYVEIANDSINPKGILVIGTFSEQGPKKCSGIEIKQYSETAMTELFRKFFNKTDCLKVDHQTPSDTIQSFIFCSFRKSDLPNRSSDTLEG